MSTSTLPSVNNANAIGPIYDTDCFDEADLSTTNPGHQPLRLMSPASSLKIDMAPWDWRRGKILLSSAKDQPYNKDETLHVFPFTVAREITVVSVIGAINEKERDMFWFSDEDEGCRWWVCQLLGDFESPGIVEVGSAAAAEEYLLRYWINPNGSYLGT
ncbi:hypothetical protein MCOR25_003208 [Pyricularia grisea]|nr:hypothetical protein MCOR25_003208 [Pyricularia grisea]